MGASFATPARHQVPTNDPESAPDDQQQKRNKFSGFFYLGKGYFRSIDPDSYLFGEEGDLGYLPKTPSLFPYRRPQPKDPTGVLKCLVHVQKDSVKLVRTEGTDNYRLEFIYDADVDFNVKILEKVPRGHSLKELLAMPELITHEVECSAGSGVVYREEEHILTFRDEDEDNLSVTDDCERYPLAILVDTIVGPNQRYLKQHHLSVVSVEKSNVKSLGYLSKVIKQKLLSDDLEFILQDVYGLENKGSCEEGDQGNDFDEDAGAECVICFTDVRDTVLLPCRHFCVCGACAASLRYKASNCPICRAPFRALLRVQAVVKAPEDDNIDEEGMEFPEYRVIPLMTALNGYPKYDPNADSSDEQNDEEQRGDEDEGGEGEGEDNNGDNGDAEEGVEEGVEENEEDTEEEEESTSPPLSPVEVVIENGHPESDSPEDYEVTCEPVSTSSNLKSPPPSVSAKSVEDDIPLPGTPVQEHGILVIESSSHSRSPSSEEEEAAALFESRSNSTGSSKISTTSASSTTRLI